jgi:hypothetical protein
LTQAEPYIAMRTGFKCSQCHLNKIGGGARTEYGQAYTQYKLLMQQTQDMLIGDKAGSLTSFDPKLNDAITIGSNFRVEQQVTPKEGTIAGNKQLNIPEANVYINVELLKNYLSFYTDQNLSSGTNRETWMMVRNLPLNGYVKVGKTLLPYGIRLVDDDAFIRNKTGYTYGNPDVAGEVGLEPGPLSAIVNVTNSRVSAVGSAVFRHARVGGSYRTSTKGAHSEMFNSYGPFVGGNFGRFSVMGEMDFIKKAEGDSSRSQVAHFYQADFLVVQGLNLKSAFEYFDRNTKVANKKDGQSRYTFGVEIFPVQFVQLGLYYRLNNSIPQSDAENQDLLYGRALVYF